MIGKGLRVLSVLALVAAAGGRAQGGAGYLVSVPDTTAVLPPPPAARSSAGLADREAFVKTRALQGSPRWMLAKADSDGSPAAVLDDYACALGLRLSAAREPALFHLADRMKADASAIISKAKAQFRRSRPFQTDPRPICTPNDPELRTSFSYPSGHSTRSWAYGLILAEIAPAHAAEVMARARAYGESRVVCGVHYPSDVEAGRSNAAILVAALHASPEFASDLQAARSEVTAAMAAGQDVPEAATCAATRAVWAASPY